MNYKFDTFSVLHGNLVAIGYSDVGPPFVYYGDIQLSALILPVNRTDLSSRFGPEASAWGFRLSALLPDIRVEHAKITLKFSNGLIITSPGAAFQQDEPDSYDGLVSRFREATRRGGRLLEIGSRARSGNMYRDRFDESIEYTGIDITAGPNVDVVCDAHHLSRSVSGKFDFVFSISVFEHLLMPWKVALEMSKVMHPSGLAFIQSHSSFPLHEEPWDFWRYSKTAWTGIFNTHTGFKVLDAVYAIPAWTVPMYASGAGAENMDLVLNYLVSACLVQKIGEPEVEWDADVAEVFNLFYDHA